MKHEVRTVDLGTTSATLACELARFVAPSPRGDAQVLLIPRVDDEGRPMGNRGERRRAARMLRQRDRKGGA